ncbi:unnamed protein product [Cylicocyclus nassatus]|uniref:Uncharacterized protein n=1 Tax=Cylicocyclus nassatus TaxID=53992 RepID=A0AA36DK43_CYLNA|nr:unnamed protein product [Cylicocyclus nassatus]
MSDDDSIDFDITISGSRHSEGGATTTPSVAEKETWIDRMHNRLAFCALCVFVLLIVVGLILLISNIQE